jgi:uncharacterized protein (DUF2141 family)
MASVARILAGTSASIVMLLAMASTPAASPPVTVPAAQATLAAAVLHVRVVNLRNSTGQVICTLFNLPAAFPSDSSKAVGQIAAPIKDDAAVCSFGGLAPGKYALVVFHDENGNGKFDRNWLGLPKEGYAFSNNVRPVFSPPSFKAAAFDYAGGDLWLTITMRY